MKYLVISNDGYEVGYDSFDTEEEALEYINNPIYSSRRYGIQGYRARGT